DRYITRAVSSLGYLQKLLRQFFGCRKKPHAFLRRKRAGKRSGDFTEQPPRRFSAVGRLPCYSGLCTGDARAPPSSKLKFLRERHIDIREVIRAGEPRTGFRL